ncbi:hypothetical protein [Halalkalibacterium ligniniphilum]|uniref:hypothetical protein n=1 Tax=Halalkalibacterium ligniniphilum TaxID=1134413 RepID=UPI000344E1AC|nr:hypothetical protein [Halalkalibacterium ligniniphilum]
MKDQLGLFYVKDGVSYPVALTEEQKSIFNLTMAAIGPIKVIENKPMGIAVRLSDLQ